MLRPLAEYRTLVFDCDGVILDSNRVKSEAFFEAALPYGRAVAEAFLAYHRAHGGVSRYRKFAHLLEQLVPPGSAGPGLDALLEGYARAARAGLLRCAVAPGLSRLRSQLADVPWMVVSGGDQAELREVFALRELAGWFEAGIFGSPDAKEEILARELQRGSLRLPALFLGDSRYDHQAAAAAGLDFCFLSRWSEMPGWECFFQPLGVPCVAGMEELLGCTDGPPKFTSTG